MQHLNTSALTLSVGRMFKKRGSQRGEAKALSRLASLLRQGLFVERQCVRHMRREKEGERER